MTKSTEAHRVAVEAWQPRALGSTHPPGMRRLEDQRHSRTTPGVLMEPPRFPMGHGGLGRRGLPRIGRVRVRVPDGATRCCRSWLGRTIMVGTLGHVAKLVEGIEHPLETCEWKCSEGPDHARMRRRLFPFAANRESGARYFPQSLGDLHPCGWRADEEFQRGLQGTWKCFRSKDSPWKARGSCQHEMRALHLCRA